MSDSERMGTVLAEDFRIVGFDCVRAPRCEQCETEMKPASDSHWMCPKGGCEAYARHIHTGVYPYRGGEVEEGGSE